MLPDLRSSKDEGQSNFDQSRRHAGGLGADIDVLPTLRVSMQSATTIYFANTAVLAALRNQPVDSKQVGEDASISLTYRPLMSQNIVLRASYARLFPASGFDALFPHVDPNYFLLNVILAY